MEANISSNREYWLNWTLACGIAEFLGIGVAAGIRFLHFTLSGLLAGLSVGAITGFFLIRMKEALA